jgi:TonB family protein
VDTQRVYSAGDGDVLAPAPVRQEMPRLLRGAGWISGGKAVLEVLINERGRVDTVIVRQGLNPMFDQTMIDAARRWTYEPARKSGTPVKYRKLVQVTLDRN